jgi:simple sugar transport system permease protein
LIELLAILPYAAPLAFAALGEIVGERSGIVNIGLEGMMLIAAFGAVIGSTMFHGSVVAGFGVGVLLAMVLAAVSALFTVVLASDQVVVGTAVNLFALGLTGTVIRAKFGSSGQLLSLPTLTRSHGFDVALVGMILSVPAIWFLLQRTAWGLAARAVGEYPKAAEAAGFSPIKIRLQAALIGGLFAGIGGAYLVLGTTGSFTENMTNGRGFVAIALVTFGRWKPTLVFGAAILMGYLDSLQFSLQASGIHVPQQFLLALPYVVALLVLILAGKGAIGPTALGTAYRRSK